MAIPYSHQAKDWIDVETCCKWFNEVFYLEVKNQTGRRILLLMENAPGHFVTLQHNNIQIVFFLPNCTSWKQPCDMGSIVVLKNDTNICIKDVLDFYKLDDEAKN